ncbi:MAG: hypothetical protein AB1589_35970 [Cyanobacteriota bacterium]
MSPTTASCCVVLNQQQQTNQYHCNELADQASASANPTKPKKYCTVVEQGRVVVKPIEKD